MNAIRLSGTGSYVPEHILTNLDLASLVDTSDEWITTRTGIHERRVVQDQTTSDLASIAAERALEDAGVSADSIDLVVVATVSPDRFTPTVSCTVQKNVGLTQATCFDLWAGCSGFVFSVMTAHRLMQSGGFARALVIGAESLTKLTNWEERSTCVLFGDGAGAVVLEAGGEDGILRHVSGSDGTRGEVLVIEGLPIHNPIAQGQAKPHFIQMEGSEVFKFATKVMTDSIHQVLDGTGFSIGDIDYVVPHQANNRIIENVANRLNLPKEKFYTNLHRFGNTSAASIPLALDEMNRAGLLRKGSKIITVGFGGGLTWGANLIQWTKDQKN